MKTIELSDDQFEQIRQQAVAAGYDDVAIYLNALVEDAAFEPRCGMTDAELQKSAEECDAIVDRMKQERGGRDFDDACRELGDEFGFPTGR